jgi:hypothetical protein
MKNSIYAAALLLAVATFTACGKDEITVKETVVKEKPSTDVNKVLMVNISLGPASYNCGPTAPCAPAVSGTTRLNMMEIYNLNYSTSPSMPTLTYKFYRKIATSGTIETYQPIPGGQYTCTGAYAEYASSYLTNGLKVLVVAVNGTSGPSANTNITYDTATSSLVAFPSMPAAFTYQFITMGNYQGMPCPL